MAAPIADFAWGAVEPDDTAFILYTGGTTGRSKGVLHTHRAMMINGLTHIIHGVIHGEIAETEKLLLTSPLPHSAIPHADWGEAVCAAVIPAGDDLDTDDLIAFCKLRLAAYMVPKVIEVVADIPLTAYGKPDKKALRQKYWGDQVRQVN